MTEQPGPATDPPAPEPRGFGFLELNPREPKPRRRGVTEIRGPYYRAMGTRLLADLLDTMGEYIDTFKFAGGTFALLPRRVTAEMIELCHRHRVRVSTGGALEHALARRGDNVDRFLAEAVDLGFDIVEVSANYVNLPHDDLVRLAERVRRAGLAPKPEISVRFGTGGGMTSVDAMEAEGTGDVTYALRLGQRYLDAGAEMLMVESEGITEDVHHWRPEVVAAIVDGIGLDRLMFEAADPAVFAWYVRRYGAEVNLFVDHTQIFHLESLRSGVGGGKDLWGRVLTYRPEQAG